MRVALLTTFRASKKVPLAVLLEQIHAAFLASGQGEPKVGFSFSDAPLPGFVSSVDRVRKRYPQLERFVFESTALPGIPSIRQISNGPDSPMAGGSIEFAILLAIAQGVPRSFPFHNISVRFHGSGFGEAVALNHFPGAMTPGVMVSDSWWVNGRQRFLAAMTLVEADPASKKLPAQPESVAAVFAACGKVKSTVQAPMAGSDGLAKAIDADAAGAVGTIVQSYKARLGEIIDRAGLPHDLPPAADAMKETGRGETTGPKKPVLERAFKPMGYDCRGESGTFTLRRRTGGNLTVEISLDVGTWSRSLTSLYIVHGLGFRSVLLLPASRRAMGGAQYPIGDRNRWQQLVDNLAALVAELDRSFVVELEAAAGRSPEWYRPES